jgi:alkanesulfonate monooxygenase SsuD/methylene tetrahydromethanopterin reductase-like flavin-dependent oxidoreductase (luciferase family)
MRFGLHSGQHRVSYQELRDLWRHAERVGFDSCYLFDHFQPLHSDVPGFLPEEAETPEGSCLEAFTTLASLAHQIRRVGVGIMVTGVGYRNVLLAGHMVATLNQAAPSRLEFGIGGGWFEPEFRAYGYEIEPARERLRRLERALDALAAWWRGDAASVEELGIRDAPVLPLHPMPRLWIAGTGEKVILRLAARYADSWNAMFLTPDEFRHKVDVLAGHCERIGRAMETVERSIALRAFCSGDGTRAHARLEGLAALRGRDPETLRGRSLVGTPIDCIERLHAYAEGGATHCTIMVHPPYDLDELELLATEVFPKFRQDATA